MINNFLAKSRHGIPQALPILKIADQLLKSCLGRMRITRQEYFLQFCRSLRPCLFHKQDEQ